jgi:hypothetical protein
MRHIRLLIALSIVSAFACASPPAPAPRAGELRVRMVTDEADAALDVMRTLAERREPSGDEWSRLFRSEAYRRLVRRDSAMGRPFTDSSFADFLRADSVVARRGALAATLERWKGVDVEGAARRAHAYLPPGTALEAVIYPMIKPRPNSFVFDLGTDSAAIFLYLDPEIGRDEVENTVAHELHHVGFATACLRGGRTAPDGPVATARALTGAFGEGLAMLAAAGSPAVDPHASSTPDRRERWHRDFAQWRTDLRRIDTFLGDVASGRLSDEDSVTTVARSFYGEAQGPWYTVGYAMATRVENRYGRARLLSVICDPVALMHLYNTTAPEGERWSPELLARLMLR